MCYTIIVKGSERTTQASLMGKGFKSLCRRAKPLKKCKKPLDTHIENYYNNSVNR